MYKSKLTYLIVIIFFLILIFNMNSVSALPHTIWGYAVYEDGIYPNDAGIIAYNKNLDVYVNFTIKVNGSYYFDVGSPGPEWNDGDEIEIIIIQNNQGPYFNWSGVGDIIIDLNFSTQQVDDIILYPPSDYDDGNQNNDKNDNIENENSSYIFNFILFMILLIVILLVVVGYLVYIRRK